MCIAQLGDYLTQLITELRLIYGLFTLKLLILPGKLFYKNAFKSSRLSLSKWPCEKVSVREPTCNGNTVTEVRGHSVVTASRMFSRVSHASCRLEYNFILLVTT